MAWDASSVAVGCRWHLHVWVIRGRVCPMPSPKFTESPSDKESKPSGGGLMGRFLTFVEWLGNLLPHPVTLFAIFAAGALVLSAVASAAARPR